MPKQEHTAEFKEQVTKHAQAVGIVVPWQQVRLAAQAVAPIKKSIHAEVKAAHDSRRMHRARQGRGCVFQPIVVGDVSIGVESRVAGAAPVFKIQER